MHIGSIIQEKVEASDMSITEFSNRLKKSRSHVYLIFKREHLNTEVLVQISEILQDDLFIHYSNYLKQKRTSLQN